jgi:hypothetical protein
VLELQYDLEISMPKIISFADAIKLTEEQDRALLIGNGFSADYFSYSTLLDVSGLEEGKPLRKLFAELKTADFEAVVRALEGAVVVERAYGNEAHAKELEGHAKEVREALVTAVKTTHPPHRNELKAKYESSAKFLSHFSTVFTVNYDLLLYWTNFEYKKLRDGFGLGEKKGGKFIGPFKESAYCDIYNLHGGLHLFDNGAGDIQKALDDGAGVVATIAETIATAGRLPVYVAEGNSTQKLKKIKSVAYLRYCYEQLTSNAASIFVYGHSADDNDAHVYNAIFASNAEHVYFGVYKPDDKKLNAFNGILSKYQKTAGSEKPYTFYDSESAHVWDA